MIIPGESGSLTYTKCRSYWALPTAKEAPQRGEPTATGGLPGLELGTFHSMWLSSEHDPLSLVGTEEPSLPKNSV